MRLKGAINSQAEGRGFESRLSLKIFSNAGLSSYGIGRSL